MDSPGKNTGAGYHFLLQAIFLTQGTNPCHLHWQADTLPLCHLRSPWVPKLPFNIWSLHSTLGHPGCLDSKESACNAGDPGLIPGQEDPLEKEMATPSSILEWETPWTKEATVHEVEKSQT